MESEKPQNNLMPKKVTRKFVDNLVERFEPSRTWHGSNPFTTWDGAPNLYPIFEAHPQETIFWLRKGDLRDLEASISHLLPVGGHRTPLSDPVFRLLTII